MRTAAHRLRPESAADDPSRLTRHGADLKGKRTELVVRAMALPLDQGGKMNTGRHFPVQRDVVVLVAARRRDAGLEVRL